MGVDIIRTISTCLSPDNMFLYIMMNCTPSVEFGPIATVSDLDKGDPCATPAVSPCPARYPPPNSHPPYQPSPSLSILASLLHENGVTSFSSTVLLSLHALPKATPHSYR